ncbi:hypothetical protein E2562_025577 [Oryza meyeriana var. granulata]|uniref:Uncharacterized protein n=1 Tax=Oryza meyeriana var. granulata TaxID=110450 RepID=A0A6G1E3Y1_9ORYZ|nr:hypothetical protein E2562_025577 [Oryza meyeriana var. granulata]
MAHDTEASGSSWASRDLKPEAEEAGPEEQPMPGEGDARSTSAMKKMKTTPSPERHPFAGSPWGFTSPKPR